MVHKNGNTAQEAYEFVRGEIVKVASHARKGELEEIDKITTLGEVFKWKIAFLYSNEQLIPIYNRSMLETVAAELGMDEPKKRAFHSCNAIFCRKKGIRICLCFMNNCIR